MRKIQTTLSLALAAAGAFLVASPGHAQAVAAPIPLVVSALGAAHQSQCAAEALTASRNAAILGGKASQLDLLRDQQARPATLQPLASTSVAAAECSRLVLPGAAGTRLGRGAATLGSTDFLASRRLPISRTTFDGQWNRVRSETLPRGAVAAFAGMAAGRDREQLLAAVNAYANRRIRYVDDRKLYGQADYWATAGATLSRGAGDCEDIAIAKMQLLAAVGVARSDMYLTIARDLLRKADHAVLVVRMNGRNWLLDNSTDRLIDADQANDYRPIFSFSTDRRWLHGY